ncbi:MAG: DUF1549 and DUF1553 domain-containing protein [Candidatus Poribacteria bacterium]|nr:DUF1549 and DUF1553 domain-containing protein [Candidatus Poribacteria bacterium]
MKKSFGITARYAIVLVAFAFLTLNCTKVTVAPTRQVSSSTKHLDRHINTVLKRKDIQPSEMSADTEFLRRVHLDLTGKIPTPEEVLNFLKDGSPNKRQKKIDQLLGSEPYIDYWTRLWVNWLIGRRGDGDDQRIGLTAWVQDALTKNMPYNQFVQELIAADGELKDNGAGNYIMRYERSPVVLTSHSSRLFLGLPMQCAECHDHKTEAWSQADYYGIAAFFTGIESEQKGYIQTMDMAGNERRMENFLITNKPRKSMWVERMDAEVSPRFLGGTEYTGSLTKRRAALAQWMTDKSNPYFSRAIVNRIWKHFMGRAFVEPIDGFGEENLPTNPELLNWLAEDLVIYDYDLRHLMRTILNSEAYQRTSQTNKSNKDDELYYSHAYLKPLSAEQFFYSLLQATGYERLQEVKMKGANRQGGEDRRGMLRELERRKRDHLERFLFLLDNGEMEEIEAFNGTVPQALMMINGNMVNDSATHGERGSFVNYVMEKWRQPADRLEYIYLNILSRLPTAKEKTFFQRYMERSLYRNKDLAYEDLYWVLLNSAEFSLNH